MRKLSELFKEKNWTFSFELFPPKTDVGYKKLLATIEGLAQLGPDFFSVTYGAGGGNKEKTLETVDFIQKKYATVGVAHLTCIGNTRTEIKTILDEFRKNNISNVLALRGDPPKVKPAIPGGPPQEGLDWKPTIDHFSYSYELCSFMRFKYGEYFSIGVAGFPEGHILCPDRELDAKRLKMKINAGADYVITQLFFENKDYYEYVKRLRTLGVISRVIPGIIPITDYAGLVNFCKTCGASIPREVHETFGPIQNDKEATIEEGIRFAVRQCKDLLENGAPGIHFYTLNKIAPVDTILKEIRG